MSIITGLSINYEVELAEELLIQTRLCESMNVYYKDNQLLLKDLVVYVSIT